MTKAATPEVAGTSKTANPVSIQINYDVVKQAAKVLRAVNHKLRQAIIQLLAERGSITVTEIYSTLRLEQSVASQHLATLRAAEIVKTQRDGKCIYYSLNASHLEHVGKLASEMLK